MSNCKKCNNCGETKSIDKFYWDKKRDIPFAKCIDCQLKRQRELYKLNKGSDTSRFNSFKGIGKYTDKELDVLKLLAPGPIGLGMSLGDAAKELKIDYKALVSRLRYFKENNPDAWDRFKSMRRSMFREGRTFNRPNQMPRDDCNSIIESFISRKWSDNTHDNNPKTE